MYVCLKWVYADAQTSPLFIVLIFVELSSRFSLVMLCDEDDSDSREGYITDMKREIFLEKIDRDNNKDEDCRRTRRSRYYIVWIHKLVIHLITWLMASRLDLYNFTSFLRYISKLNVHIYIVIIPYIL